MQFILNSLLSSLISLYIGLLFHNDINIMLCRRQVWGEPAQIIKTLFQNVNDINMLLCVTPQLKVCLASVRLWVQSLEPQKEITL